MTDLYGRKVRMTLQSLADGIAGAAQMLMGETRETIPFVLVRSAPVTLAGQRTGSMTLPAKDCLHMSLMPRPLVEKPLLRREVESLRPPSPREYLLSGSDYRRDARFRAQSRLGWQWRIAEASRTIC